MKTNILQIPRDAIFLCGGDATTSGEANADFAEMEKKLLDKGYNVFNPVGIADHHERLASLIMCDKVVTLPDWERWERSVTEAQVARAIGMEIIHAAGFERWEEREALRIKSEEKAA